MTSSYYLLSPHSFTLEKTLYRREIDQHIAQRSYPSGLKVVFSCAKGRIFDWGAPLRADPHTASNSAMEGARKAEGAEGITERFMLGSKAIEDGSLIEWCDRGKI
jgi:hypothetical protein